MLVTVAFTVGGLLGFESLCDDVGGHQARRNEIPRRRAADSISTFATSRRLLQEILLIRTKVMFKQALLFAIIHGGNEKHLRNPRVHVYNFHISPILV